jgi:hypothetical protein
MQKNCLITFYKKFYFFAICAYFGVCIWLFFSFFTEGQMNVVVCPSKLLFHIPCPGCGITRATILFLQGNVLDALSLNPNVIFSIGYLFVFPFLLGYDIVTRKKITYKVFDIVNSILKIKWIFISFSIFESIVWIHNIINHI